MTATRSDVGELGDRTTIGDDAGQDAAEAVDRRASTASPATARQPVADHAGLADRERDEDADRVERDQGAWCCRRTATSSAIATALRMTMPEVNARRSPRKLNWRGMKPSSRQDGGQPREGVVARVRGEEQDQGRERLEQVERDRAVAVDDRGDLADHRPRPARRSARSRSASATKVIPMNSTASRIGHRWSASSPRSSASGGLNAGTPLAMASVPVSATEPAGERRSRSRPDGLERRSAPSGSGLGGGAALAEDHDPEQPIAIISSAEPDEQVGRDREDVARLAQPAQVAEGDQRDRRDADPDAGTVVRPRAWPRSSCSTADESTPRPSSRSRSAARPRRRGDDRRAGSARATAYAPPPWG